MGGADAKIIPYSRENSSGTYVFFKEHVLNNADYTPGAQAMPGTAAVVNAVAKEKFGIGYGGEDEDGDGDGWARARTFVSRILEPSPPPHRGGRGIYLCNVACLAHACRAPVTANRYRREA